MMMIWVRRNARNAGRGSYKVLRITRGHSDSVTSKKSRLMRPQLSPSHKSSLSVGRKKAHQMMFWAITACHSHRVGGNDDCCVVMLRGWEYGVMRSDKHRNRFWISGQGRDDKGRGIWDRKINLFGISQNHSLYWRHPRPRARAVWTRAAWTRVGAIKCNYPVRKHRKVRISFLFTEWGSIRSPDLYKVSNTIMREILKLQTKNWVDLRTEDLFYGSIISQIKLWVRTKGIKKNFYDTGWWESKPVFVLCWVLYLSYHSYLHFYCQQPSASDISYISFCQNMDFLPSSQDFWVFWMRQSTAGRGSWKH